MYMRPPVPILYVQFPLLFQLLISQNAPLFTENELKQTPCDTAEKSGHTDIALYLESKMVFSVSVTRSTVGLVFYEPSF